MALVPVAIFAALGGFLLSGLFREDPDTLPSALIGREAPAISLTELPGKTALTPEMLTDGEVKLVNFWASWCVPCRVEHPQLEALAEELPVYGVNYKDSPENALAFLAELGDPFSAIGVDEGRTGLDWGLYGVPETFVLDGDGTVLLRFAGPITRSVAEDQFLPVIEEARR
ncbi:DsbE family thiol:disulfide interchange protein [Jannaschia aquimarina]|nr:DsbE family thiol:disulfide interchange protein [Jannaschia aquimarina]